MRYRQKKLRKEVTIYLKVRVVVVLFMIIPTYVTYVTVYSITRSNTHTKVCVGCIMSCAVVHGKGAWLSFCARDQLLEPGLHCIVMSLGLLLCLLATVCCQTHVVSVKTLVAVRRYVVLVSSCYCPLHSCVLSI